MPSGYAHLPVCSNPACRGCAPGAQDPIVVHPEGSVVPAEDLPRGSPYGTFPSTWAELRVRLAEAYWHLPKEERRILTTLWAGNPLLRTETESILVYRWASPGDKNPLPSPVGALQEAGLVRWARIPPFEPECWRVELCGLGEAMADAAADDASFPEKSKENDDG